MKSNEENKKKENLEKVNKRPSLYDLYAYDFSEEPAYTKTDKNLYKDSIIN